jgi:hypothetical protein
LVVGNVSIKVAMGYDHCCPNPARNLIRDNKDVLSVLSDVSCGK